LEREIIVRFIRRKGKPCTLAKMTGVTRVCGRLVTLELESTKDLLKNT